MRRERRSEAAVDLTRPAGTNGVAPLAVGLCANQVYCSPTRGGVLLQAASGDLVYSCTATILGTVAGTPANATMTAGHCFEPSAAVYAGQSNPSVSGYLLGYVSARRFSGNADAEDIRWTTGNTAYNYLNNCVYIYSSDCQRMTVGGGGYTGMAIQKSGITTGLTSGTITQFSMSVNIADDQLLGITSAVGGLDSSGNCTSSTRSYFGKLGNGNAALGFSPRFTA